MSLFIVFEGGEGCGKSSQTRILWRRLLRQNIPAILTHEPGGTALGNKLRRMLKRKEGLPISPEAELLLFAASRAQLVTEVIHPALQQGKIVICDRFSYSTLVYQGHGRGLKLPDIEMINNLAAQNLKPDVVILLDLLPEQGLARKSDLGDRFELEKLSFHHRVREGYLKVAAFDPDRWLVVDATLPKRRISGIVWRKVNQMLPPSYHYRNKPNKSRVS